MLAFVASYGLRKRKVVSEPQTDVLASIAQDTLARPSPNSTLSFCCGYSCGKMNLQRLNNTLRRDRRNEFARPPIVRPLHTQHNKNARKSASVEQSLQGWQAWTSGYEKVHAVNVHDVGFESSEQLVGRTIFERWKSPSADPAHPLATQLSCQRPRPECGRPPMSFLHV